VVGILRVDDADEILLMTSRGKIQRVAASDISVIGRNTQGVRIMGLDQGDSLVAMVRVPSEEQVDDEPASGGQPSTGPAFLESSDTPSDVADMLSDDSDDAERGGLDHDDE
jgi:DNA gyrase subunit A